MHSEGNNFFKAKKYEDAIAKYSDAIELDPTDVTFYSNRSACYAAINRWQDAADDGKQCIIADKNFVKGYFRHALALQNLNNLEGALDSVKRGLGIESGNADLKKMSRELEEALRLKKVDAAINLAENQISSNDIPSAFKTIEGGLRLDPTNASLNRLMGRVKPAYERLEKQRVSTLDPRERIKEEGDNYFKAASFEQAIVSYTKCIDSSPNKVVYCNYWVLVWYNCYFFYVSVF